MQGVIVSVYKAYKYAITQVAKVKLAIVCCWSGVPNNRCAGSCIRSVILVCLFCGFVVCSGSRCFTHAFVIAASSIKVFHLFPATSTVVNLGLMCGCVRWGTNTSLIFPLCMFVCSLWSVHSMWGAEKQNGEMANCISGLAANVR